MEISCRHFNGYKPCGKSLKCERSCPSYTSVNTRILIIHLEALGAVLRSTSLLAAIRRKYSRSHITWVTKSPAHLLLQNLVGVDRVLTLAPEDLLRLSALRFDLALVIDKSLSAAGVLKQTSASEVRGFNVDALSGAIVPANPEALELWRLGLSDHEKFFVNQKSEQQLVHEALALGDFARDEYAVTLSREEQARSNHQRKSWSPHGRPIVGLNTGCSATLPHKKLSVAGHRRLIDTILAHPELKASPIVLLGGPEDSERNLQIAQGLPVLLSSTRDGLRDGLVSVNACDLVFSGDSLGMHMAIGLKKWVVAWFGPSCAPEIDLYGRGRKIQSLAPCSPCWKRDCQEKKMCYDQVDLTAAVDDLAEGLLWLTLSSKPRSPEISFSASPY